MGALDGKTAIITGATSGIGLGVAEALADQGANIMINGLPDQELVDKALALLNDKGVKAVYSDANMMNPDEIVGMVAEAEKTFGAVDILVNNAGVQHVCPIEDFPPEKWDMILAIDLSAVFHGIRSVVPLMRAQGWGRIINVASAHALVASPFKAAYVAAKHGVAGLTKTAALEVAQDGITVNAIAPGYVFTPLVEKQIPDTAAARGLTEEEVKRDVLLAAQPTKEFVTVEQIGGLAVFLCSPSADSINGTILSVDGGWTAQ